MKGKKILIGITGSIAAYKIPSLVRLFVKAGAEVKVVMTPASAEFVSPVVLATLSKNNVGLQLTNDHAWENHVMLGRWADLMLIAPASMNSLSKMAQGLCDNLLMSVYFSATCPIMIAPAMDEDMWHHAANTKNLNTLKSFGHHILNAEHGELASGLIGMGRMMEPESIFSSVALFFDQRKQLSEKKALVTAGPTYENLDPVRFIGNYSTGKMGVAIAIELASRGCEVELVLGPSTIQITNPLIHVTRVRSAAQMYEACVSCFDQMDFGIMSAAVADYTPVEVSDSKIKKKEGEFNISLTKTKDILKELGSLKKESQVLIGFALENRDEKAYALKKLVEKNADAIVMNSLNDEGAGFGKDTNKITIFCKNGSETNYTIKSKQEVAIDIVDKLIELMP
ncbi:MAG: bifunctional phosphopantothenoylcysteine decarboxylase/phosphopantothenate--cysteine ligase CoaBC [Chitinophagaceae bacterium]|nr:bifunctional phosphopantothenoylcysteine decarboxylase/phosphopantothenate--cysteine ligase CoaBC [Chitinophagaceae bacterium]